LHFDGRHDVELRAGWFFEQLIDDLIGRLRPNRNLTLGAMRLAKPCEQDAEVVVNFSHGTDGGSRRVASVALFDGDCRRKAVDMIDLRLLHLADELASVRTEAFDVASLAFGIDRVHGERRFSGTARPAKDGHLVAWDFHVQVPEVVLAGAADGDVGGFTGSSIALRSSRFRGTPGRAGGCRVLRGWQPPALPGVFRRDAQEWRERLAGV
jgi:hypothetical protein